MFRHRGRRLGFTAVEVLAVAGILTGLGGNAFVGSTSKAHQTACQQHLRQIGMAVQMRTMTGEPLPRAWFYPPDPPHRTRNQYHLANVMSSEVPSQMFICPASPQAIQQRGISYVYNDQLGGKVPDQIPNPAGTWLMMDINVVSDEVPPAHNGGCNVLFVDGHVKWYPASQLPKFSLPQQNEGDA
ncbi:MAG: prepilin-type N-terminal cleavage/methylation domain-containing protein [Armatimonadota bacterium]